MNALESAAIVKAADKLIKAEALNLEPGTYPVSLTVKINGTVTKGEGYKQAIVNAANPWRMLALLFDKINGVTIESVIRESENLPEAREAEIKAMAKEAMSKLTESTKRSCAGKLTASLSVEAVLPPVPVGTSEAQTDRALAILRASARL